MNSGIGTIAQLLNVSVQSVRSWERQGLIPKAQRRPTGMREYSQSDIEAIRKYLATKKN